MQNVLVMGGTTFFGKRLVDHLLKDGCKVTVATRGQTKDDFGEQIQRIRFDRHDLASMKQAFEGKEYEIVFDQIGYCADDMADVCEVFSGKIGHYVFTSSIVVYYSSPGLGKVETDFDPLKVRCTKGKYPEEIDYRQGKEQAEAYLAQNALFPFAAARIPGVIGPDDPTKSMNFLVNRILDRKPIVIPADSGPKNHVEWDDAGRFLAWLGKTSRTGAYNAGSEHWIKVVEMTRLAGEILGVKAIIVDHGPDCDRTQYADKPDVTVDVSKAKREGFEFTPFDQWFPKVVKETAKVLGRIP